MTVEINPEFEEFIAESLRHGRFRSVDDVVNRALAVLKQSTFSNAPRSPRPNLADFLLNSPFAGAELDLERRKDYPRPIEL
jgi:Arc/MetJ-type ribon-helix-helix transcriptional regulator